MIVSKKNYEINCMLFAKPTFDCHFLTKSSGSMEVIFLHRFRGWKDFLYLYVYAYVCIHARGRNFYLIDTKFGIQVGLTKNKV